MKIKVVRDPLFALIIDDMIDTSINKAIYNEAIALQNKFEDAIVHQANGIGIKDTKYRNNKVCYYDNIYWNKNNSKEKNEKLRKSSSLLNAVDNMLVNDNDFRKLLQTSPYPLCELWKTNEHYTQVSSYGYNESQKYDWHPDAGVGSNRLISMVYYFSKNPHKFNGGELLLTSSPVIKTELVEKNPRVIAIDPKNNRIVVFASSTPHCVQMTSKVNKFEDARFSANIWIGI